MKIKFSINIFFVLMLSYSLSYAATINNTKKDIEIHQNPIYFKLDNLLRANKNRINTHWAYDKSTTLGFDENGKLAVVYSSSPGHKNFKTIYFNGNDFGVFYVFKNKTGSLFFIKNRLYKGILTSQEWLSDRLCHPSIENKFCEQWQIFKNYPQLGSSVLFEQPTDSDDFFEAFAFNEKIMLDMLPY